MGVYTRPDSPYFWMAIERKDAEPLRRSTHIPCKGLTPQAFAENKKLAQQVYLKKVTTKAAAAHGLVDDRERIEFSEYADWYETHVVSKNHGGDREKDILKHLRRELGNKWLDEIDRACTKEYMTARTKQRTSARTVNREVDLLKSMLRDACPRYLEVSPLVGMRRLKVTPPRRHYMTEDEEDRIIRVLKDDPVGRALLHLGTDSLVRLGDLLDFRREDDRGRFGWAMEPKDPRQPQPYTFPISKRARRALDQIPNDGPHYFARFRVAKKRRDWNSSVRQWLEKVCNRANVKYGRKQGGIVFHWATRRTGASRMLRDAVDLKSVQRVGNWKSPEIVLDIYSETFDENASKAVEVPGRRRRRRTPGAKRSKAA